MVLIRTIAAIFFAALSVQEINSIVLPDLPEQRPIDCLKMACRCHYGTTWYIDSLGCERCSCNPRDDIICPKTPLYCPRHCRMWTNSDGCKKCICDLIKPPECPIRPCARPCPNGVVYKDGCPTCECKPSCQIPACLAFTDCFNGFRRDSNGCLTCQCNPGPFPITLPPPHQCPSFTCSYYCRYPQRYASQISSCPCRCSPVYLRDANEMV